MVSTKLLDKLIELDDQITDFDQEDLEGIDKLLEKRLGLLDEISEDTGPEPEKFEEPEDSEESKDPEDKTPDKSKKPGNSGNAGSNRKQNNKREG